MTRTVPVSCIITSCNNKATLAASVRSVLDQTSPPAEIIIADDASTDGSRELIEEMANRHPSITPLLRHSRFGVATNRGSAILSASQPFVTQLDGDDFAAPGKIEAEWAALEPGTSDTVSYSRIVVVRAHKMSKPKLEDPEPTLKGSSSDIVRRLAQRDGPIPRDMMMSKDLFERIGGFQGDLELYEDWHFKLRLALAGVDWRASGADGTVYMHWGNGLSTAAEERHTHFRKQVIERLNADLVKQIGETDTAEALRRASGAQKEVQWNKVRSRFQRFALVSRHRATLDIVEMILAEQRDKFAPEHTMGSPLPRPNRTQLIEYLVSSPAFEPELTTKRKRKARRWVRSPANWPSANFDPGFYARSYGVCERRSLYDFVTHGWRVGRNPRNGLNVARALVDVRWSLADREAFVRGVLTNEVPLEIEPVDRRHPKITAITINLNNFNGLERTFASVQSQVDPPDEYIVVDGGSTDGSRELIDANSTLVSRAIVGEDNGLFDAMNIGAKYASGDYIVFMNSGDCFAGPDTLSLVRPYLGDADIVYGQMRFSEQDNPHPFRPNPSLGMPYDHQTQYARRSALLKWPLDTASRVSDWKFVVDAYASGATFRGLADILAIREPIGASSQNEINRSLERYSYSWRHFPNAQVEAFYLRQLAQLLDAEEK